MNLRDKLSKRFADWLPRRVVYWAIVRMINHAMRTRLRFKMINEITVSEVAAAWVDAFGTMGTTEQKDESAHGDVIHMPRRDGDG